MSYFSKNIFIIPLLFIVFTGYSQKEGTIDFNSKKGTTISAKKGDTITISFGKVNTLLYNYKMDVENYDLVSEAPSSLSIIYPGISSNVSFIKKMKNQSEFNFELLVLKEPYKIDSLILKSSEKLDSIYEIVKNVDFELLSKTDSAGVIEINNYCDSLIKKLGSKENAINTIVKNTAIVKSFYENMLVQNSSSDSFSPELLLLTRYAAIYENSIKVESTVINLIKILDEGKSYKQDQKVIKKFILGGEYTSLSAKKISKIAPSDIKDLGEIDIYTKGGFKLDFSVGLGGNTLVSNDYYFEKNDQGTKIGVASENGKNIDLGILTLLHLDYKIKHNMSIGLQSGVSISVFDASPRYLLGVGYGIGPEKTVYLSGGLSWGNVKQLSGQISSDGAEYTHGDLSSFESVPMTTVFDQGYYFGITYNLSRKRVKRG